MQPSFLISQASPSRFDLLGSAAALALPIRLVRLGGRLPLPSWLGRLG